VSSGNGFNPLVKTLTEHKDVIADLADSSLEAAEEIPVFGWAVKAWNVKNTYQAKRLYRNTQAFLESSSVKDAQQFIGRFGDDDEKEELCDTVIQVLIDSEKPFKARLASNLLNSIYDGKITVANANALPFIISNASVPALKALDLFYISNPHGHVSTMSSDAHTLSPLLMSMGIIHVHGNLTRITQLGESLHQNAFA